MFQFFDTETTGKFDFKLGARQFAKQPHIVQIGMVLTDADFNIKATWNTLIEPVDAHGMPWEIEEDAQAIHGIGIEECKAYGIPIKAAMVMLRNYRKAAQFHICHNERFDAGMVDAECYRLGGESFLEGKHFCTMQLLTNVLKLPGKFGFKWPKLDEAYAWATGGKPRVRAHDAMADILDTIEVFKAIKAREPQLLRGLNG